MLISTQSSPDSEPKGRCRCHSQTALVIGDDVVLKVIRGTILDLKGSVTPVQRPEDSELVRQSTKRAVATKLGRDD